MSDSDLSEFTDDSANGSESDWEEPNLNFEGTDALAFDLLEEDYAFERLLTTNDVPTSQEKYAIHQQIDGSDKKLEALRQKIELLEEELKGLRLSEDEERRRNGSYRRLLAPIKSLPVELLGEIFGHLHSIEEGFPFSVSLVCLTWRRIILKTPKVWSTIRFTPKENNAKFGMLSLSRCGSTTPIGLIIEGWDQPQHATFIAGWLAACKSRIQCLRIKSRLNGPRGTYGPHVPIIPGDSLEMLEELEADFSNENGNPGWDRMNFALFRPHMKLSSLKRLHLFNTGLPPPDIPISLHGVTHLTLHGGVPVNRWDLRNVLHFLIGHPNLQSFDTADFTQRYDNPHTSSEFTRDIPGYAFSLPPANSQYPSARDERVSLPNIQYLSIDFGAGTVWFLDRLVLPNLETLKLKGATAWNTSFENLAKRSSFALKSLSLEKCILHGLPNVHGASRLNAFSAGHAEKPAESQAVDALCAAPTIRDFAILDSMRLSNHLIVKLTHKNNNEPLLAPNLRHLRVQETIGGSISDSGFHRADREKILDMFASRKPGVGRGSVESSLDMTVTVYRSGDPFASISATSFPGVLDRYWSKGLKSSQHLFF